MSTTIFHLYTQACFDLARSILVKSEATARAMCRADAERDAIYRYYGMPSFYNKDDPKTWRYYLHMAGIYHVDDEFQTIDENGAPVTDKILRVRSVDDYSIIEFTTENLKRHKATRRTYKKGSTYYQNLVDANPTKRLLIDGILNPIPMEVSIPARDNEILWYDKSYVEENEYTLMNRIQTYIDRYYGRWDNSDYEITDNLYVPSKIAIMYIYLPYVIMGIRLELARTIEVHSFHVWNYLGSHQWLDEFKFHLNLYQKLWFHRNIRWSEVNAGKYDTFHEHIRVIMTERNLPIGEFFTHPKDDKMRGDNTVFHPDIFFKRVPLNLPGTIIKSKEYRTPDDMVDDEIIQARDNELPNNIILDKKENNYKFPRIPNDRLPTKVLETSVTNQEITSPIKKQDVEVNHWIYMTCLNMYRARLNILNTVENERMNMTQKDAVIVWIYCLIRSFGWKPTHIPVLTVHDVLRVNQPEVATYRPLMDSHIADYKVAYALKAYSFNPEVIISTERFAEYCHEVYEMKQLHRNIYNYNGSYRYTALYGKIMSWQFFETIDCKLTPENMTFEEYFKRKGWTLSDTEEEIKAGLGKWTTRDYEKLAKEIFEESIGSKWFSRLSVKEIQGMMVRLLKKLSSYSIQLLTHYSDDDVVVLDQPYLRYSLNQSKVAGKPNINLFNIRFTELMNGVWHQDRKPILGKALSGGHSRMESTHRASEQYGLGLAPVGSAIKLQQIRMPLVQFGLVREIEPEVKPKDVKPNPWDMTQFRIHKTTEDRSSIQVGDNHELIVRGVVYVKSNYKGGK